MRRVCWASTFFSSTSPGFWKARSMAFFVISLKTTRLNFFLLRTPSDSERCQQIASPSRSGSAAR